jgi:hypothetical protein
LWLGRAAVDSTSAAVGPPAARPPDELAAARARVAELERLVGRQQVDLDFFKKPCGHGTRRAEAAARPSPRRRGKNDEPRALDMGIAARNPPKGLIHRSDRGVQYACAAYAARLAERKIEPSMGRPGNRSSRRSDSMSTANRVPAIGAST